MRRLHVAFGLLAAFGAAAPAAAIPMLQLYIDGGAYDPVDETWVGSSTRFDLWVLGLSPVGGVKLAVAFRSGEAGSITLTPTTAGDFDGVPGDDDTSTPGGGVVSRTEAAASADGAIPLRGDASRLPSHGIYGPGVSFLEFELGHFTLVDSPIGDYQGNPTSFPKRGQVNVYTVSVTGFGSGLHFDSYGYTVSSGNGGEWRAVFAPFSHDAEVPEPSAALLLLGAALGWNRRRLR